MSHLGRETRIVHATSRLNPVCGVGVRREVLPAMKFAIVAMLLVVAPAAAAQPSPGAAGPPPLLTRGEPVSEGTALGLSLGGTVVALGVCIAAAQLDEQNSRAARSFEVAGALGVLLAPSFGHWYARSYVPRGLVYRLLGGLSIAAAFNLISGEGCEGPCGLLASAALVGAIGTSLAGVVDDIASAPDAAQRYNQRPVAAVLPLIRHDTAGVLLVARF